MIVRCVELYHGRWCPICGKCSCWSFMGLDNGSPRQWAVPGAERSCPLHGDGSQHGQVKVLTAIQEGRIDALIRRRVQDALRCP